MSSFTGLHRINRYFAEIQPKKYKHSLIKAVAHYCFLFFEQFDMEHRQFYKKDDNTGKGYILFNSGPGEYHHRLTLAQGTHYPAEGGHYDSYTGDEHFNFDEYNVVLNWYQVPKKTVKGKIKYRWDYGFSAHSEPVMHFLEITFTGNWDCVKTVSTKDDKTITTFTYYPVFSAKLYQASYNDDLGTDGFSVFENVEGTPIYYVSLSKTTDSLTKVDTYNYISEGKSGIITTVNPAKALGIISKSLSSIKTSHSISLENMVISGETGHIVLKDGKIQLPVLDTDPTEEIPAEETAKYINTVNDYPSTTYEGEVDTDSTPPTLTYPTSLIVDAEKPTYICLASRESLDSDITNNEEEILSYYHKINNNSYEVITIKNFVIDTVVGPGNEFENATDSYSMLAPDSLAYIPIMPELVKKLNFIESMIIYQLSLQQNWRYWYYEEVSWWVKHRALVIGIGVIVIVTIMTWGSCTALVAAGVISYAAAVIVTGLVFGLSLTALLLPDDQSDLKQMLSIAVAIITTVVTAGEAALVEGAALLSVDVLLPIVCTVGNVVFDIVYDTKQNRLQEEAKAEQATYSSASMVFSNKRNLLSRVASISTTGLVSTYSGQVACGLNCDEVTDLMRDVLYVGDIVDLSMGLKLDVFLDLRAGTGNNLFPTA